MYVRGDRREIRINKIGKFVENKAMLSKNATSKRQAHCGLILCALTYVTFIKFSSEGSSRKDMFLRQVLIKGSYFTVDT